MCRWGGWRVDGSGLVVESMVMRFAALVLAVPVRRNPWVSNGVNNGAVLARYMHDRFQSVLLCH